MAVLNAARVGGICFSPSTRSADGQRFADFQARHLRDDLVTALFWRICSAPHGRKNARAAATHADVPAPLTLLRCALLGA